MTCHWVGNSKIKPIDADEFFNRKTVINELKYSCRSGKNRIILCKYWNAKGKRNSFWKSWWCTERKPSWNRRKKKHKYKKNLLHKLEKLTKNYKLLLILISRTRKQLEEVQDQQIRWMTKLKNLVMLNNFFKWPMVILNILMHNRLVVMKRQFLVLEMMITPTGNLNILWQWI